MVAILAIAFCGSMFAQETHWPFNTYAFEDQMPLVAFVQVDGSFIESDNYADYEVGAFVGDEVRGTAFFTDYTLEFGDPHPIIEMSLYFNTSSAGEAVSFKLYNHATGVECVEFTCNKDIVTGEEHTEEYFDYDDAVIISFVSPAVGGFEKDIIGFGDVTNTTNYYLIASPIGSVDPTVVDDMIPEGAPYDLFGFDQSQNEQEWRNYKDNNFTLEPGVGYLYANQNDVTLVFHGNAYDGEGTFPLAYDDAANLTGWNLVGNPYGNSATIDKSDFYVMNETGSEIVLAERTTVDAMEGIFVIADGDGDEITFTETMGGDTGGEMGEDDFKFDVRVYGTNGNGDVARIRFGMGSVLPKFQIRDNSTKLYFPVDNEEYAVVRSEEMGEMPMNFKASSNGTYSVSYNSNTEFSYLHLIDNMTGADVDLLATPSYSFEATTNDYASRFKLVFATGNNEDNFAFYSNGSFVINNAGEATLQVVDVTGRVLRNETISGSANVSLNAAPGVYMLRLINGDNMKVQKVVVR